MLIKFWSLLAAMALILQRVTDHSVVGAKTPPPAGSVGGVLGAKAAAWIATVAAAVSTTIVIYLPSVRYTAEWFIAPRYFFVKPPPGWIKCSCPERHSGVGAFCGGSAGTKVTSRAIRLFLSDRFWRPRNHQLLISYGFAMSAVFGSKTNDFGEAY